MAIRAPAFTSADHKKLDLYLLRLMEAVRDGLITPAAAQRHLVQQLAAVDIGNYTDPLASASHPQRTINCSRASHERHSALTP